VAALAVLIDCASSKATAYSVIIAAAASPSAVKRSKLKVTRAALESAASIAALLITTETAIVEQVVVNPGAIVAPGFGDLAEGMVRPSNIC
jgi:hypothetical protein